MKKILGGLFLWLACMISAVQLSFAEWTAPEERVFFGEGMGSITQTIASRDIRCPLVYQDVVYKLDNQGNKTDKITVTAYGGVAFVIPEELKVRQDREMRAETRIEIVEMIGKGIFLTRKGDKAAVPFIISQDGLAEECVTYRNMVWVFSTPLTFNTKRETYTVTRPQASISFTKNGLKLDGVKRTKIQLKQ